MNTLAVPKASIPGISGASQAGRDELKGVLGAAAWARLPSAVRERFAEPAMAVDYEGEFNVVCASAVGRVV